MQFEGDSLRAMLASQAELVDVYLPDNSKAVRVPPRETLFLAKSGAYVGVGNIGRIRYLRPLVGLVSPLHSGSRTTQRIRNEANVIIAPKPFVEHKPVPSARALRGGGPRRINRV